MMLRTTSLFAALVVLALCFAQEPSRAHATLLGTDVTAEVSDFGVTVFGPASETVVDPGAEFSFNLFSGLADVDAIMDFDADSVNVIFDSKSTFPLSSPADKVFTFTDVSWDGMPQTVISDLIVLENTLTGSTSFSTDITGPDAFEVTISQFNIEGEAQRNLRLQIKMIPEPSTVALAICGLVSLGLFGWWRRRRAA